MDGRVRSNHTWGARAPGRAFCCHGCGSAGSPLPARAHRSATCAANEGYLRSRLSVAEAADLLWVLTSFETFDQLYSGRRLSQTVVARRIVALAEGALLVT